MSATVYRIRSRRPLVWTTPTSLQVGVDSPVAVVTEIPDQAAPLIHALQDGISADGYQALGKQHRVPAEQAKQILDRLSPAFEADPSPQPPTVGLICRTRVGNMFAKQLALLGLTVRIESSVAGILSGPVDLAALAADFLLDPSWPVNLGPTDTKQLPVVFTDSGVQVGPLITPGESPCLSCRELWHREDPNWLGVASQLWNTEAIHATAAAAAVAALFTASLCNAVVLPDSWVDPSESVSLQWSAETGRVTTTGHQFHPSCRCRGL